MQLVSLEHARVAGLKRYFTGKPCVRGHIAERRVNSRGCIHCLKVTGSEWKKQNRVKCTGWSKVWRDKNREKVRKFKREWNAAHDKEKQKVRSRRWYEENKQKSFEAHYRWAERNQGTVNAAAARRRARVLNCTPSWADMEEIRKFYALARVMTETTGVEYHVDHIDPLQGKTVCGLHVEMNLQILPANENRSKSNKLLAA